MQPEQPQQPQPVPLAQPTTHVPTPVNNRKRTILALWLMIGPTALLIVTFILFAIVNFIFSSTGIADDGDLFGKQSVLQTVVNVLLYLAGAITILTWLPGLIIGIVLLATKKR